MNQPFRSSFIFTSVPEWPPLAWLARCDSRSGEASVLHGPGVETAKDWFCEAAWDGAYESGDFDRTDIVAGSGGRLRDDAVTFVASGASCERLHSFEAGNRVVCVSNSLPCLVATVGGEVDPTDPSTATSFAPSISGSTSTRVGSGPPWVRCSSPTSTISAGPVASSRRCPSRSALGRFPTSRRIGAFSRVRWPASSRTLAPASGPAP